MVVEGRIYEYTSAANPSLKPIPVLFHPAEQHQTGPTRVIPFDLSANIGVPYPASSPNLMASFVRVVCGEHIETKARATSQAFYVISGKGESYSEAHGKIPWSMGDMIVLPRTSGPVRHTADEAFDCALYWVTDEPLLRYLGCTPTEDIFRPTVIRREQMLKEVERVSHEEGSEHRNRMGVLLGNRATDYPTTSEGSPNGEGAGSGTLTLTPTLWSLLNVLPANDHQQPHRHNSVALDLAVYASASGGVYTLMGPELDATGTKVKDPIRCDWSTGSMFLTPPGWWHSHHNESDEKAWVLPMQDAGLYTYQRTLDIRFAPAMAEAEVVVSSKTEAEAESVAPKTKDALKDGAAAEAVASAPPVPVAAATAAVEPAKAKEGVVAEPNLTACG